MNYLQKKRYDFLKRFIDSCRTPNQYEDARDKVERWKSKFTAETNKADELDRLLHNARISVLNRLTSSANVKLNTQQWFNLYNLEKCTQL